MIRVIMRELNAGAVLLAAIFALAQVSTALGASGSAQLTIVMQTYTVVKMTAWSQGGDIRSWPAFHGGQIVSQHPTMPQNLIDISAEGGLIYRVSSSGSVSVKRTIEPAGSNCTPRVAGGFLYGFESYLRLTGEAHAGENAADGKNCLKREVVRISVFIL